MSAQNPSRPHKFPAHDRRHAPRSAAQLEACLLLNLSPNDEQPQSITARQQVELAGRTRNISETGLALIVPSTRLQSYNLVGHPLLITLNLPTGQVLIHAMPERCERLEEKESESGYLVGVRITRMSDKEWVRLVQYVRRLG